MHKKQYFVYEIRCWKQENIFWRVFSGQTWESSNIQWDCGKTIIVLIDFCLYFSSRYLESLVQNGNGVKQSMTSLSIVFVERMKWSPIQCLSENVMLYTPLIEYIFLFFFEYWWDSVYFCLRCNSINFVNEIKRWTF